LRGNSSSAAGIELGLIERVGSTQDSPTREQKTAKALRVARWQLYGIIQDAPRSVPKNTLQGLVNFALITDCFSISGYHLFPLLDSASWAIAVHDMEVEVPQIGMTLKEFLWFANQF